MTGLEVLFLVLLLLASIGIAWFTVYTVYRLVRPRHDRTTRALPSR